MIKDSFIIDGEDYTLEEIDNILKGMILDYVALKGLNFIQLSSDGDKIINYLHEEKSEMCNVINFNIEKIVNYMKDFIQDGIFLKLSNDIFLLHKKANITINDSMLMHSTFVLNKDFLGHKNIKYDNGDQEFINIVPISVDINNSIIRHSFLEMVYGDIRISINPEIYQTFEKNSIGQIPFTVVNTGDQIVTDLKLELIGPIEIIGKTTLNKLSPKKRHTFNIGIKPYEIGSIPILYKLICKGPGKNDFNFENECWIKVNENKNEGDLQKIIAREVHIGDRIVDNHSTKINNSVVQRSTFSNNQMKAFNICPFCGEKLDFLGLPKYCPFCTKKIMK